MKVNGLDYGVCGVEQLAYIGKVAFDTDDVDNGVALYELPQKAIITGTVAVVGTAFDAGTTNVLTAGTNSDVNNLLGSGDVTEGTTGAYQAATFVEAAKGDKVKVKYTQTGTAATAGAAELYIKFVSIPD